MATKRPKYRVVHPTEVPPGMPILEGDHRKVSSRGQQRHWLYGPSGYLAEAFCSCQFANTIVRLLNAKHQSAAEGGT